MNILRYALVLISICMPQESPNEQKKIESTPPSVPSNPKSNSSRCPLIQIEKLLSELTNGVLVAAAPEAVAQQLHTATKI